MHTPSTTPAILTEATFDCKVLSLLVGTVTLGTKDNGLKIALCDIRKMIAQRRSWELRTSGLTLHETKARTHVCTFAACSCGARTWCVAKALLYVLRCYQLHQELAQEVIDASEDARTAQQQDQLRDDAYILVPGRALDVAA